MNNNFFLDKQFNDKLLRSPIRTTYAKIILLSFDETEQIRSIEGQISAGSINVNGNSAIRRTLSLTMIVNEMNSNVESLHNEIAINKKIKVEIGYKNNVSGYEHYGDIVWFPQGVYIISSVNISKTTSSYTITIQGKDKMVKLDGTVGGIIPAITTFHEMEDENGILQPITIFSIIQQAVQQYGEESINKIIINDLDHTSRTLLRFMGEHNLNICFSIDYSSFIYVKDNEIPNNMIHFAQGQNVGYEETPLVYPGELILNAGDTVTTLLTKINEALGGNYEFFYDIDGNFIFQEKKNYINKYIDLTNINSYNLLETNYRTKNFYNFTDCNLITNINQSPKYEKIKNNLIVWGERKTSNGSIIPIRFHLLIKQKPTISLGKKYIYAIYDRYDIHFASILDYKVVGQKLNSDNSLPAVENMTINDRYNDIISYNSQYYVLIAQPDVNEEWREELYRNALISKSTNLENGGYDIELLSEWRKIYDTIYYQGWNSQLINNPELLDYWLEFIDDPKLLTYSVDNIGVRTKLVNDKNVTHMFSTKNPDEIYFYTDINNKPQGKSCLLTKEDRALFTIGVSGFSAFDKIRSILAEVLRYNTQITITCYPVYGLEPNQIISLNLDNVVTGTFLLTQFTVPLVYNGTMSLTLNEILYRI